MRPIEPPDLIDKGIVLYAPSITNFKTIKLEIYYSTTNPIFSWVQCDTSEQRIWEKMVDMSKNGTLFVYYTSVNLKEGFYNMVLTAYAASGYSITGNCLVGLTNPKERLFIGMPYSSFPPIPLS